jgi:hypothetical protein
VTQKTSTTKQGKPKVERRNSGTQRKDKVPFVCKNKGHWKSECQEKNKRKKVKIWGHWGPMQWDN